MSEEICEYCDDAFDQIEKLKDEIARYKQRQTELEEHINKLLQNLLAKNDEIHKLKKQCGILPE